MKLWIRSQDREMLCKVECVELMHDDPEYAKIFLDGKFPDLIAGAYEKERALEVLDEIQRILVYGLIDTQSARANGSISLTNPNCIVYEMPKE